MAAGCGGAGTTPVHQGPSATPASSPSSVPASPSATATPTPTATPTAPATPEPLAAPDWLRGDFDVAMGNEPLLQPADDFGRAAGTQIDDFGFDLLRHLNPKGNLCVSPTSIAIALGMLRPGARGATGTEMDKVLHGFGADGEGAEISALMTQLRSIKEYTAADGSLLFPGDTPDPANPDPTLELNLANAAFLQKGTPFEQAYLNALSSTFNAGAGLLDFQADPEAARAAINRWAKLQTRDRIPEVLHQGDVDESTRIALANAIYLKAAWAHKFDPKLTKSRTFTTASGTKRSVPTMAIDAHFSYGSGTGYRAVEIPYWDAFSMTVIVPTNMASFVSSLDSARLQAILGAEVSYDVDLTLPRFSIDSRFSLGDVLSAMGMPTAFTAEADLSGITTQTKLYVSKVIHQANIDVVEEGTTAAAVTVVVGATMGGGMDEPAHVQFHVDKPFLYFIHDNSSGAVLFMGRVDDPSAK
jgi:serpin B